MAAAGPGKPKSFFQTFVEITKTCRDCRLPGQSSAGFEGTAAQNLLGK
jgi:hypothetical protein